MRNNKPAKAILSYDLGPGKWKIEFFNSKNKYIRSEEFDFHPTATMFLLSLGLKNAGSFFKNPNRKQPLDRSELWK